MIFRVSWTGASSLPTSILHHPATLRVKVFAQSPFGNQLFWFKESFFQIKSPAPKSWAPWGAKC